MKKKMVIYSLSLLFISVNVSAKETPKEASHHPERLETTCQKLAKSNLIYLNEDRLQKSKKLIRKKDVFFTEAYQKLIAEANKQLGKNPDPVTNKTQIPPSGDKHDFLSIAPYRWPNPDTANGFPWILKDGQINPMTTGRDTDYSRLSEMFGSLDNLAMAYYFSGDIKYANKAKSILKVWFMDAATKVNPNINYGQGIPGEVEGRRAGMISWSKISTVVTAIQILDAKKVFNKDEMKVLDTWLLDYYTWLKTNKMGIENDNGEQNHSTNYDYQLVGIARYLGLNDEAKSRLEAVKTKRIQIQIEPDGKQPKELGRTKSVHYCSMNLRIMSFVAEMGMPLGVDLWNYSTSDGRSMKKAFEFLRPYAEGKQEWMYKQITEGGIDKAIDSEMKPLFSIASTIFNEELIDGSAQAYQHLSYLDKLKYPPLFKSNN